MRAVLPLYVLVLGLAACGSQEPEADAQIYLTEARVMMQVGQYSAARDTIMSLRKNFPTSFKTRAQAILVLDSIEFLAAEDSLSDSLDDKRATELRLRADFFRRKLQEDLNRKK